MTKRLRLICALVFSALLPVVFLVFTTAVRAEAAGQAQPLPPPTGEEIAKVTEAMPDKALVQPRSPRKILIFDLCQGFVHDCIPLATETFKIMGRKTGAFEAISTNDMEIFTPDKLRAFDAVLFNNTTHLEFSNEAHRKALMEFVKSGKGIIGIHAASDNFYTWPEAAAMMGGVFDGHPWTGNGTWAIKLDDPGHILNLPFEGKGFRISDEIYQVKGDYSRDTLRVLMSLDMDQKENLEVNKKGIHREDMDFGVSWIRHFGEGRVFYCSLGHNHPVYWNPAVLAHYLYGIQWALGDLTADATPSHALAGKGLIREGLDAFRGEMNDWLMAGEVFLDPKDPKKLSSKPGDSVVLNGRYGIARNLVTEEEHGDVEAHIEFMVPEGSNSGVYFMGRYEIQILDSCGKETLAHSDCGGIYQRWDEKRDPKGYEGVPPRVNAALKPGEWQSFDVLFKAPRFDEAGRKTANAVFVRVALNNTVIQENQEVCGPTRAALFDDEKPRGPLMLQGDHGPIAFRKLTMNHKKLD